MQLRPVSMYMFTVSFAFTVLLLFGGVSSFPYITSETEENIVSKFEQLEDLVRDALGIEPDVEELEPDLEAKEGGKIPDVAEEMGATDYIRYLTTAKVKETLMGEGPFTAFGPTNKVFESLPDYLKKLLTNETSLVRIMKYGVITEKIVKSAIKNDMMMPTILGGENKIRFNVYQDGKVLTASGRRMMTPGKMASNGMFYEVMGLIQPPTGTITYSINHCPVYTKLAAAMKTCGMDDMLTGEGPYTMFAPTDKAWEKLPKATMDDLMKNATALKELLGYHVVKGTYYSAAWSGEDKVTNICGKELKINMEGEDKCTVNGIPVTIPDTTVTNGVVHVIDDFLMPPTAHLQLVFRP